MSEKYREEKDSLGIVQVPEKAYWGAQTQRSLQNFPIGWEKMPEELIRALAVIKRSAAAVNSKLCAGKMTDEKRDIIFSVCEEILEGRLRDQFPLSVWQTGSGTQTNMNVNEVVANRGNELAGKKLLHPNDDVNMSQSSNDVFPAAADIACAMQIKNVLVPALEKLIAAFIELEAANEGIIKCGRTHLQDAVPIAFSQEISGWRSGLEADLENIKAASGSLCALPLGGTAVGTGLNAPKGFDAAVAAEISRETGLEFSADTNKFRGLSLKNAFVYAHGSLKALAADLMKIANDVRWLASGPRCGLGEIKIPENEPGSSIMPGKVNPTQCEAVTMAAVQVMGNDAAIGFAASQGNFELNVYMPVIAYNFLQSVRLLTDVMESFTERCVKGIIANTEKMEEYLDRSLMLVTALSPHIGYEKAAKIAQTAASEGSTLKEACLKLGYMDEASFDKAVDPGKMV